MSTTASSFSSHAPFSAGPSSTLGRVRASERFRPPKSVGSWQLVELIGRGRFADVYSARPAGCVGDWPADYAVKILPPERTDDRTATQLLQREAEVGCQVSQAHLISVLESHVDESPRFVVMPRLNGATVSAVLAQMGHFSVRQSLWVTRQIAEALRAMHDADWLHGDVKPSNVIVTSEGHATLIDLGFALRRSESRFARNQPTMGTLNYLAPEAMTSALCVDRRSDIYSLGITLFEMLTGQLPFTADNEGDLVAAHRSQPIPDPRQWVSGIPAEALQLLRQMTAKEPLRRPQSATELIERLMPLEVLAIRQHTTLAK